MISDTLSHGSGKSRRLSRPGTGRVLELLERFALPLLLGVVFLIFSSLASTADTFTLPENLRNVFGNQAVLGILAIASILPLIVGHFDLSVGATASITQIAIAAAMSKHGVAMVPAEIGRAHV